MKTDRINMDTTNNTLGRIVFIVFTIVLFSVMVIRIGITISILFRNIGNIYLSRGSVTMLSQPVLQSQIWFENSLKMNNQDANTWQALGRVSLVEGHLEDADVELRNALTLQPQWFFTHFLMSKLAELRGDDVTFISELALAGETPQIERYFDDLKAKGQQEKALAILRVVQVGVQNATLDTLLGETIYEIEGDADEASILLEAALGLDRNNFRAWDSLTEILRKSGQFDHALVWTSQWISRYPDHPEPYVRQAEIYFAQEQYQNAICLYISIIERFPQCANCYYRMGQAYQAAGVPIQAVMAYERAITLAPETQWYHLYLADAMIQAKEWNRAKEELLFILEYDPTNAWAQGMLKLIPNR